MHCIVINVEMKRIKNLQLLLSAIFQLQNMFVVLQIKINYIHHLNILKQTNVIKIKHQENISNMLINQKVMFMFQLNMNIKQQIVQITELKF